MSKKREEYSPSFKSKVVLAAIREGKTVSELCAQYELYLAQINTCSKICS